MPEYLIATEEDFIRFYGGVIPSEWKGVVLKKGRLVKAFGGAYQSSDDEWYVFLDVPQSMKHKSLFRQSIKIISELKEQGAKTIKAACNENIPRSSEFLKRLGFEATNEITEQGEVIWKCQV